MAKLFKLSKKMKGKVILDSVNTLPVINRRKQQLISSYRGQKVEFIVEPADEDEEKYRKPLTDGSWRAGGDEDRKRKNKNKVKRAKRNNG